MAILRALCCLLLVSATAIGDDDLQLREARRLLARGNYEEAIDRFSALSARRPTASARGRARALREMGRWKQAEDVLQAGLAQDDAAKDLQLDLAQLALHRGDRQAASRHLASAGDETSAFARWLRIELAIQGEQSQEAAQLCREAADQLGKAYAGVDSAEPLHFVGLCLAAHGRLNRDASRFTELVNQIYPRALTLDPDYWQAHYEIGRLLAEKHNDAEASDALRDALRINPRAAVAHIALAKLSVSQFDLVEARTHLGRALDVAPHLPEAHCVLADIEIASLNPKASLPHLEQALAANPQHAGALGRRAAAQRLLDNNDLQLAPTIAPGQAYQAAGEALELARRYPLAVQAFRKAKAADPLLVGPHAKLGMNEMRLGREGEARQLLKEAFRIDPYNLRVKNQLEVLDLLDNYATLETPHFSIRYDKSHDGPLAVTLSEYSERCYEEFSELFEYELPDRALIEIFRPGRGHTGGEWFGVRMAGLPNIHTIAACGGNIIAMESPLERRSAINWADVTRHEIVHLFNLQQTRYNVPHWFTEGCAVFLENRPRRQRWNRLLVNRAPQGDVFNLSTINEAFLRPKSADDWQLAYCQAELYVECLVDVFGPEAIPKMLAAYRNNLSTADALRETCGASPDEVEAILAPRLAALVGNLAARRSLASRPKLSELERRRAAAPDEAEPAAALALARLKRGDYAEAGRLAAFALELDPASAPARLVRAKLLLRIGDSETAEPLLASLAAGADGISPDPEAIEVLAGLLLRRGELIEAGRWYARGAELEPGELSWTKARTVVALKQGDDERLARLLKVVAEAEPDNLLVRRKRLQLAERSGDPPQIARWAREVLHIDPRDGGAQRALAESEMAQQNPLQAAPHFELAAELLPDRRGWTVRAAKAWQAAGKPERAVELVAPLAASRPDDGELGQLLQDLSEVED